jgi:pimeloyl-ACP methyl ester carboxylesterase
MYVDVNNARFWVEEAGAGPTVLFLHFGLGDWRVLEPELRALADEFRCVAYDRRFFGRTEAPTEPYSDVDDAIALMEALDLGRAALVGVSGGGKLALDIAAAHPERVWAVAHIAAPVSGIPWGDELEAAYADADTPEKELEADLKVWAPLGAEDFYRELLLQARPSDVEAAKPPPVELESVRVPTLVITAKHDPPSLQHCGREAARRLPQARLVELDTDHYLTLREPELVTTLLREFLSGTSGAR